MLNKCNSKLYVLLNQRCLRHLMNRTQSKNHRIGTSEINKILLLCFSDKVHNYFNF